MRTKPFDQKVHTSDFVLGPKPKDTEIDPEGFVHVRGFELIAQDIPEKDVLALACETQRYDLRNATGTADKMRMEQNRDGVFIAVTVPFTDEEPRKVQKFVLKVNKPRDAAADTGSESEIAFGQEPEVATEKPAEAPPFAGLTGLNDPELISAARQRGCQVEDDEDRGSVMAKIVDAEIEGVDKKNGKELVFLAAKLEIDQEVIKGADVATLKQLVREALIKVAPVTDVPAQS